MTIIPLLDYNGINLVSLFAGMDAFSHAGKTIGTETIFHNDILPESNLILELNYGKLNHYIGDIKDLSTILSEDQKEDIEKLKILHSKEMQKTTYQIYDFFNQNIKSDIQAITINLKQLLEESTILTFGWNCQEFSIRNQNQNPQSERATAFRYALKLIDIAKPKMIIIENVLRTPKEYIFEIEHFLKSIGYHVLVTFQKNLSQFGAFQIRQRLFIIAIKSENINGEFTKPYSPTYQPNKIPISCVLDSPYADPFVRPNENIIKKAIDLDYSKWSSTSNTSGYGNLFLINPKLTYTHALTNISKNYYLLKFYINNELIIRMITKIEALKLFGYDKDYKIPDYNSKLKTGIQKSVTGYLIGNTIPVQFLINLMVSNFRNHPDYRNIFSSIPELIKFEDIFPSNYNFENIDSYAFDPQDNNKLKFVKNNPSLLNFIN